jgi:DNA repair photolyase
MKQIDRWPRDGVRGRGSGINPANRFEDLHLDVLEADEPDGAARPLDTHLIDDSTRTLINRVDSPDLPFHWTINPYRGCEHGCVYCYARPTHETLGYSCGLDFETRIVVKRDAHLILRRELSRPAWQGEPIVMSGVTDPYQPAEARLEITRRCLEVMAACRQPVSVVTKSRLVGRDRDLLGELARHGAAHAAVSVTTLSPRLARVMEPRASRPADRLAAIRMLADAGVPVQVMMAPLIPCINEHEVAQVLRAAADAGARSASWVLLRLPFGVKDIFAQWLRRHFPERAAAVEARLRQASGGSLYDPRWGARGRGQGVLADQIRAAFGLFARRAGLGDPLPPLSSAAFIRPDDPAQMSLFAAAAMDR